MRNVKGNTRNILFLLLALFLFVQSITVVFAYGIGYGPLDGGIEMISKIFYPSRLLHDQTLQIGFYKFLYFIIIMSVSRWVLLKVFKDDNGPRVASTVAFAFAAIAAWFMPERVALGSAGMIAAILNAIIPIGLVAGALYLVFKVLKGEDGKWWEHAIGLVIILLVMAILQWTIAIVGFP